MQSTFLKQFAQRIQFDELENFRKKFRPLSVNEEVRCDAISSRSYNTIQKGEIDFHKENPVSSSLSLPPNILVDVDMLSAAARNELKYSQ